MHSVTIFLTGFLYIFAIVSISTKIRCVKEGSGLLKGGSVIIVVYLYLCPQHHISCLTWAAGRGYLSIVQLLLSKDAKVNTADKVGGSRTQL